MNAKVTTYNLTASNGKHIRKATMVIFENGAEVKFMEAMPKKEAIAQAIKQIEKTYTLEHKLCDANPTSSIPEEIWTAVFSFNAMSDTEAQAKANGWARYHSFSRNDVRIRPATDHEAAYWLHNEWVN